MSAFKLFHYPLVRSVRVRWMLNELGLPYELVKVNLPKGEHKGEEFSAVNPNQALPVLQFNDR